MLAINGRLIKVVGHKDGDKRQVWVNGQTLAYERVNEAGGGGEVDVGSLSASIPAVVSEVLVEVLETR